eukprot:GHVP01009321.1.p1 GENE.GHVP01009321.1~~GHVP01009321.1.p1  ORF type:complete len:309 (-),score=51.08 GHVP01009321.1:54-980(-)
MLSHSGSSIPTISAPGGALGGHHRSSAVFPTDTQQTGNSDGRPVTSSREFFENFARLQNAMQTQPGVQEGQQWQNQPAWQYDNENQGLPGISPEQRSRVPNERQGGQSVSIKLHSMKDDFDELAEVFVELDNADQVVERMLETLAMKFPPESVMTIEKGGRRSGTDDERSDVSSPLDMQDKDTPGQHGEYDDVPVRYVEVPIVEEVIRHVPKKQIVEIEKLVPKREIEWIDKIVEVPQIKYVDKVVEVEKIEEVVKEVRTKHVIDVPKEIIRELPVIMQKIIEEIVEVPGEVLYIRILLVYIRILLLY